ncbi:MAG: hypothetical protein R3Y27_00975 [Clostridia bacterium]
MTKKLISFALAAIMMFSLVIPATAAQTTISMDDVDAATLTSINTALVAEAKYYIYRVEGLDMSCCYDLLDTIYDDNGDGTYTVTIKQEINCTYTCTLELFEEDGEITYVTSDYEVDHESNIWIALIKYGLNMVKDMIVDAVEGIFSAE